jgi:hypothetical protein
MTDDTPPAPFPCRSGKLREKIFRGSRLPESRLQSMCCKRHPAESKARRGNGREARNPPDRRTAPMDHSHPNNYKLIVSHGCYMVRNLAVASGRQVLSAPRGLERMGGAPCPWRDCGTFASTLAADTVAAAGGFACLSDGSPFMRARASAVPAPPRTPRRRARAGPSRKSRNPDPEAAACRPSRRGF